MSRLRKLANLEFSEVVLLINFFMLLPLMALLLKIMGLRRSQQALSVLTTKEITVSIDLNDSLIYEAKRLAWLISIASSHGLCSTNCLHRSLALWFVLRFRGINSDIRLAVRNPESGFEAHAWLEINGHVLNDNERNIGRYFQFNNQASSY